jgi:hypothetical protein
MEDASVMSDGQPKIVPWTRVDLLAAHMARATTAFACVVKDGRARVASKVVVHLVELNFFFWGCLKLPKIRCSSFEFVCIGYLYSMNFFVACWAQILVRCSCEDAMDMGLVTKANANAPVGGILMIAHWVSRSFCVIF